MTLVPPRFRLAGVTLATGRGRRRHPLLAGVDLVVPEGEVTALLGPSGAGKTTVSRILSGRIGWDDGTVEYRGRPVAAWPPGTLARENPRIAQDPCAAVDPCWTLAQIASEPLRIAGIPTEAAIASARAAFAALGLSSELLDRLPHQVSGGELQRAVLARALAGHPSFLILDEPFAQLDPPLADQLIADLATLLAQRGIGALLIVHDLGTVQRLASRVAVMREGRIVFAGATGDLPGSPFAAGLIDQS